MKLKGGLEKNVDAGRFTYQCLLSLRIWSHSDSNEKALTSLTEIPSLLKYDRKLVGPFPHLVDVP